jgi:hypothetical protein
MLGAYRRRHRPPPFQKQLAVIRFSGYIRPTMNKNTQASRIILIFSALVGVVSLKAETPGQAKKTDEILAPKVLTESQAYRKAEEQLLSYFKNELMKTQQFKDTFGDIGWEDISEEVADSVDIVRDRKMEKELNNDTAFAFTGAIFDFYAEITIDTTTGGLIKAFIDLDSW